MNTFGRPHLPLLNKVEGNEKVGCKQTSEASKATAQPAVDMNTLPPNGGAHAGNHGTDATKSNSHGGHNNSATLNAANGNGADATNPPGSDGGHDPSHTSTDPLSSHGGKEPTDLGNGGKVFEPSTSEHHNSAYGTKLNSGNVEAIADKMGIDYQGKIAEITGDDKVFLGGKTPEQKEAGANLVLNSAMQVKTLKTEGIDDKQFLENAATAKKLALAGDEQGLEKFINENGNNEGNLNGKELVALFEVGEHQYNHPILNSEASGTDPALNDENTNTASFVANGHDYFHMTHLTSLNTDPGPYADDKTPETIGGYNDKGAYYQVGSAAATVATMERSLEKLGI
ncbi:MAG: hypothetical protein ACRDAM_09905 [Casimicrobium sp.]